MNRIKQKLRSRSGASITFALLLFLVCAVLSSVIIVASTASAGRMAGIAESDQRYYSVSSASELLKELLDGKTVSIVTVTTSSETTTYTDGSPGDPVSDKETKVYLVPNKNAEEILAAIGKTNDFIIPTNQISGNGALGTALPTASILNDAAYKYYGKITIPVAEGGKPRTLTINSDMEKIDVNGTKLDPLAVTVEEKLEKNGKITLTVYNTNGDRFKQTLEFSAKPPVPVEVTNTVPGEPMNHKSWETLSPDGNTITQSSYTITTTTSVTEITSLNWKLDSIKTMSGSVPGVNSDLGSVEGE